MYSQSEDDAKMETFHYFYLCEITLNIDDTDEQIDMLVSGTFSSEPKDAFWAAKNAAVAQFENEFKEKFPEFGIVNVRNLNRL